MGVQINGSEGNVIATKGTFSGDVGIGGTLTYEDVTNIDSVGLITARSGIEIGASPGVAASISVDGNAIFSGITTIGGALSGTTATFTDNLDVATSIRHIGDTDTKISFDTNIIHLDTNNSERLRIDPYGRVLIGGTSAIIGSSSAFNEIVLTGKTRGAGITLQDVDANVRFQIITDDNSSGTLGTLLNASTNHDIFFRTNNTERLRISSSGDVRVGTASSVSGLRYLDVSNTSNADDAHGALLRLITSNVANTGTTSVDIVKYKDGNFFINNNESSGATKFYNGGSIKLSILNTGLVTAAKQYFLIVDLSSDIGSYNATGSGGVVIFNRIVEENKDSSLSSCFNTSTGLFTAPVTGLYFLEASVYSTNASFGQSWWVVAGARKPFTDEVMTGGAAFTHNHTILRLTSGETVGYLPYMSSGSNVNIKANQNHTYMKIALIC